MILWRCQQQSTFLSLLCVSFSAGKHWPVFAVVNFYVPTGKSFLCPHSNKFNQTLNPVQAYADTPEENRCVCVSVHPGFNMEVKTGSPKTSFLTDLHGDGIMDYVLVGSLHSLNLHNRCKFQQSGCCHPWSGRNSGKMKLPIQPQSG